ETIIASPIINFRILELPLALCPDGKVSLGILAARPESTTVGFNVWLARNVNNEWLDSYNQITLQKTFALRGQLLADYGVDHATVDNTVGLVVSLNPSDVTDAAFLGDQTLFDGLSNNLMAIVEDEFFSVVGAHVI